MTSSALRSDTLVTLIAYIQDGVLAIQLDGASGALLFHEGYGALLRLGETGGTVELHRVRIGDDPESIGHVEPLT